MYSPRVGPILFWQFQPRETRFKKSFIRREVKAYLAGVWSCDSVDKVIEGTTGTCKCLCTHSSANLRQHREMDGVVESKGCNRGREGRSIENSKVLFGCEWEWSDAMSFERLARRNHLARTKCSRAVEYSNRRIAD